MTVRTRRNQPPKGSGPANGSGSASGFTLLEVMVALAIAASVITSAALIIGNTTRDAAYIEKKLAADIAARNLMDRHRFNLPANQKAPLQFEEGETEQAGYTFSYTQTITDAAAAGLARVDITVYDIDGETKLRTLAMFAAQSE